MNREIILNLMEKRKIKKNPENLKEKEVKRKDDQCTFPFNKNHNRESRFKQQNKEC